MQIGALDRYSYNYNIRVIGQTGIKFNETAKVYFINKQSSILIQTDKAMYKPGDRIQFRVLVVDIETKPVNLNNEPIQAYIQDPRGNKIKQWENIKMENGVFKGDLKLSKEPILGMWLLHFSVGSDNNKQMHSKVWEVAEYVLPKFEVISSQPVVNTYKSGKLIFGVEAKYTYGKPVKGTLTVAIYNQEYSTWTSWGSTGPRPEQYNYKIIPIDGKAVVELDLKELKIDTSTTYTRYQYFELIVMEELTGISEKNSISVPITVQDFQISHISDELNFKPGLTFSFYVKVTRPDGKPIIDKQNPINVAYGFDNSQKTDLSFTLDDQGMVFVSFTAPLSAQSLEISIKYRDSSYTFNMLRAISESNNHIQANILTKP
jgi:CD109 antigen